MTGSTRGKAGALEVEHVALELGGRSILKDASFSVAAGEFIGVLGPNGAGKTTLMRAMLGLLPLSKGTIHVNGAAVVRGNPSVGYMPQTRSGLAGRHLRGRDFVAMAADGHRWGLPRASAAARADVDRVLDLVGGRCSPRGHCRNCRAANGSVCCSHNACSATPNSCFSMNP